jgi:hypothetical protein
MDRQCPAITRNGVRCRNGLNCPHHSGTGLGSTLYNAGKYLAQKSFAGRVALAASGPRTGPTARFSSFLQKEGNQQVVSVRIGRKPIISGVKKVLDFLSRGKFSKTQKDFGYDQVYHNFLIVEMADGHLYRVERNHVVEAFKATQADFQTENYHIPLPKDQPLTLQQMVHKASRDDKGFWRYSPSDNNCQKFTQEMLLENGLVPDSAKAAEAVNPQDAKSLIDSLGALKGVPQRVTDVAGSLDRFVFGDGIKVQHIFDSMNRR